MKDKILLIDDDEDILEFLTYNLEKEGYEVRQAMTGIIATQVAKEFVPDLIILDIMMPDMDGIETCVLLRKNPELKDTIITFLTARSEDYSQVEGFEAGADDYIFKPIRPNVLKSRIKALLKRKNNSQDSDYKDIVSIKDLIIDREKYHVLKGDEKIILPRKEFEILILLASSPQKVFERKEIFKKVWGDNVIVGDRTIDVHVRKLREKIGESYIKTVKGVGYKFE